MRKKQLKQLGIILIISSLVAASIALLSAVTLRFQRLEFFRDEDIYYEEFTLQMADGYIISGVYHIDNDLRDKTDNSVPTILILNGITATKEHHFYKAFQLVKRGYAVFNIEQRGHGQSSGPSGFLGKEPGDMIEVIDHIEETHKFANVSNIGLLGFSFGGGIGAILQAIEPRVHASVLYHPLTSLDELLTRLPFQYLIGETPTIEDMDNIQDAYDKANESNTKNLLLIQGTSDVIVVPEQNEIFYERVNGSNRNDVELELRKNFGHSDNEADLTSLKHAIVWLEHFYHNNSIDINNRAVEINSVVLYDFPYPEEDLSLLFSILSAVLMFMGMSVLIVNFIILPKWKARPFQKPIEDSEERNNKYKQMFIYRTAIYLSSAAFTGLVLTFINHSFMYGYFLVFPLVSILGLLFIPSELHESPLEEWKNWRKYGLIPSLYCLLKVMIPFVILLVVYNVGAVISFKMPFPIFNSSFILYIAILFASVIMDFLYLRELKPGHSKIIMLIRPISLIIFIIFVPIQPFPVFGGLISLIIFIAIIGVVFFLMREIVMALSKYYKSTVALYGILIMPFVIFLSEVFFRII